MEYKIEGMYVGKDGNEKTIDSWFKTEPQRTYRAEPVMSKAQQKEIRRMIAPNWMQALYSIGF